MASGHGKKPEDFKKQMEDNFKVAPGEHTHVKKMLSFAVEGITSLSTKPIKMITSLGFFIFFVSIVVFIYCLVRFFTGHT
ncbi:MAG: hypothetical protein IKP79_02635, partial [Bacilli bacterium]|nr:hypothetical protein [Bacilli bacterium]